MNAEFKELCLRVIAGLERNGSKMYLKIVGGELPMRDGRNEDWFDYNARLLDEARAAACAKLAAERA